MGQTKRQLEQDQETLKFMRVMDIKPNTYTIDQVVKMVNYWSMTKITKEEILKQKWI